MVDSTSGALDTAAPVATAREFTTIQGLDYAPGIHALSYMDAINGEQLCRDYLWLATTTGLDALHRDSAAGAQTPNGTNLLASHQRLKEALSWALHRIEMSLDCGEHFERARAALESAP